MKRNLACWPIALALLCGWGGSGAGANADENGHRIRIVREDAQPAAARVSIIGADEQPIAPTGVSLRTTARGQSYFYADELFVVPANTRPIHVHLSGGLETLPTRVTIQADSPIEITAQLRPWIDMAARGWYSGDSHIHLHTGGMLNVSVADALLAVRAENLNFANLCASNVHGDDIHDADLITGRPHPLSTERHLLVFGEEMRSMIYGHMQFFGIKSLVTPQYTGFDNTPQHDDYPANGVMAAEAVRQGGLVTYGHPLFTDQPNPFSGDLAAPSGAARELPVDAMLGYVQAVDLMSYNSDEPLSAELWYRLLNCGLRLAACAGTDALLDRSTDPLGGSRVYVKVDGPLNMQSWLDGLRRGRSFVTNGPMLQLSVNGHGLGDTVSLDRSGSVAVECTVESHVPVQKADVIVNGRVVHSRRLGAEPVAADVTVRRFKIEVPVERSGWIALRVTGPDHPELFDGPAWAHTSPVFIEVAGRPIPSAEDASYFVEWIDQLLRVVAARNRYSSAEKRQEVESMFREAQEKYRTMAASAP